MTSHRGNSPWCMNRRTFLAGVAGTVGASTLAAHEESPAPAVLPAEPADKTKIRLVFSNHHEDARGKQSEAGWPYLGYDCAGRRAELLAKLQESCPGITFLPTVAYGPDDAKKLLLADAEVDGYLAYMIGGWAGAGLTIAEAGRPVIFAGDLYGASGEFLEGVAVARRRSLRAFGVTSSRFEDLVDALRAFETLKKMRASVVLVVGSGPSETSKATEELFGTKVRFLDFPELNAAYAAADRNRAGILAARWIDEAARVVEPTRAEVEKSGAMYLAMRGLLQKYGARAITVDCLGGFYGGRLEAYPCLGHFQLGNDGLIGACEADLPSTLTMLMMGYLSGRPGFISDPVIDTAMNRIIYVHCVAVNKVFGPKGPSNPYIIRSHAEDGKGAAIQSLMPSGQVVTTLKIAPERREVILHQAKTAGNVDDPRSCRTKLAAEVKGDVDKLFNEWDRWGWHRVTFFGDHKPAVSRMCALLGFKLIEEA